MTLDEIKQLVDFVLERDLSEFELERADVKLRLKSGTV
ncbi:MAG: acetyl-CoA carboxylase, biotin carboxyl carrier protein, partial [Methylophilaceae bacterium]|nr:acetyl-CoA carboxylase, biotin carboxyl carrier protein [Methylophilaceae bacterium]